MRIIKESSKDKNEINEYILEIGYANNNGYYNKRKRVINGTLDKVENKFNSELEKLIQETAQNNDLSEEEIKEYREEIKNNAPFEAHEHVYYAEDPDGEWVILVDQVFDEALGLKEDTNGVYAFGWNEYENPITGEKNWHSVAGTDGIIRLDARKRKEWKRLAKDWAKKKGYRGFSVGKLTPHDPEEKNAQQYISLTKFEEGISKNMTAEDIAKKHNVSSVDSEKEFTIHYNKNGFEYGSYGAVRVKASDEEDAKKKFLSKKTDKDIEITSVRPTENEDIRKGIRLLESTTFKVVDKNGKKVPHGGGFISREEAEMFATQYGQKGLRVAKESLKESALKESYHVDPIITKFDNTFKRNDNIETFNELEDLLGAEELYGGSILEIKNIRLYQYPTIYDDSVSVEYRYIFDVLVDGDFDRDNNNPEWIRFDTNKIDDVGSGFSDFVINAYYDYDGETISEIADAYDAGNRYNCVEIINNLLYNSGYESIENVDDILTSFIESPIANDIEESLKESSNKITANIYNKNGDLKETKRFSSRKELDNYISKYNVFDMEMIKDVIKNRKGELDLQDTWKIVIDESLKEDLNTFDYDKLQKELEAIPNVTKVEFDKDLIYDTHELVTLIHWNSDSDTDQWFKDKAAVKTKAIKVFENNGLKLSDPVEDNGDYYYFVLREIKTKNECLKEDTIKNNRKNMKESFEGMREKANRIEKALEEEGIWCIVYPDDDHVIVSIDWGDWKHEHLRADLIISKLYPDAYIEKEITEEDGSDTYSAIHKVYFSENLDESFEGEEARKRKIDFLRRKIGILQNKIDAGNSDSIIIDQGIKDTLENHLARYTNELKDIYDSEASSNSEIIKEGDNKVDSINVKKQIIKSLNEIKENITYASEENYSKIYNACLDDYDILDYINEQDYVTSGDEDALISENSSSIDRLRYFIGNTYSADIYRLNGYGNLENVTADDLKDLCDDIIKELKNQIQELRDTESELDKKDSDSSINESKYIIKHKHNSNSTVGEDGLFHFGGVSGAKRFNTRSEAINHANSLSSNWEDLYSIVEVADSDVNIEELVKDIVHNEQIRISRWSDDGEITLDSDQLFSTDVELLCRAIKQRGYNCKIINTRTVKVLGRKISDGVNESKKKELGAFVNLNAGDVEEGNKFFNKATGAVNSNDGEAIGENLSRDINIEAELLKLDSEDYRDLANMYDSIKYNLSADDKKALVSLLANVEDTERINKVEKFINYKYDKVMNMGNEDSIDLGTFYKKDTLTESVEDNFDGPCILSKHDKIKARLDKIAKEREDLEAKLDKQVTLDYRNIDQKIFDRLEELELEENAIKNRLKEN